MEPVRSQVLKGLIEGLVLHALEREPTHGYGILKDLEEALGERPGKNQVYPLLRDLEEEGYIESEPVEDARTKQLYRLTDRGEERLSAYRSLPHPFKNWIASVFGLPHLSGYGEESEDGEPSQGPQEPDEPARAAEPGTSEGEARWVKVQLDALPRGPKVKAPHAEVSIDRAPRRGTWSLTVENHEPGAYEGADACPLTYLYLAVQRLLLETGTLDE